MHDGHVSNSDRPTKPVDASNRSSEASGVQELAAAGPKTLWLVITGSRIGQLYIVNARKYVQRILTQILEEAGPLYDRIVVVQGVCKDSPDVWARALAITLGVDYLDYPALWGIYGPKVAGFIRNEQMMSEVSAFEGDKQVLAFWDKVSNGTDHAIQMADKYKLPYREIDMSSYREEE